MAAYSSGDLGVCSDISRGKVVSLAIRHVLRLVTAPKWAGHRMCAPLSQNDFAMTIDGYITPHSLPSSPLREVWLLVYTATDFFKQFLHIF